MLNWSVLNNSIQRFFELSPARNDRYYIDWDIMRTNIWLAVNKVSNAENFEALYSIHYFTYAELNMRAAANICKRYSKDTGKTIYYPRSFDKEMETIRDTVAAN